MSIFESDSVDFLVLESKVLKMIISDHLDWKEEYEHLLLLQEKINSYIAFYESGQYEEMYPDSSFEYGVIEIHFLFEPTKTAFKFLDLVQKKLVEVNLKVECHIESNVDV